MLRATARITIVYTIIELDGLIPVITTRTIVKMVIAGSSGRSLVISLTIGDIAKSSGCPQQ